MAYHLHVCQMPEYESDSKAFEWQILVRNMYIVGVGASSNVYQISM